MGDESEGGWSVFFFLSLARNVEDIETVEFGLQPVLTYVDSLDREKQLNL